MTTIHTPKLRLFAVVCDLGPFTSRLFATLCRNLHQTGVVLVMRGSGVRVSPPAPRRTAQVCGARAGRSGRHGPLAMLTIEAYNEISQK